MFALQKSIDGVNSELYTYLSFPFFINYKIILNIMKIIPINSIQNPQLIRPNWETMAERKKSFLWLDKNENLDLEYLNWLKVNILTKLSEIDISTYPDLGSLYSKLANHLGCGVNNLLFTAGSDGSIRTVFQTFINPNDIVFITNPSFAMYDVYCKIFGAHVLTIDYYIVDNDIKFDYKLLINKILKYKPKLVCLPNPDSPTGTVLEEKEIVNLLETCIITNTLILIDEAYYPFYKMTTFDLLKNFSNLIICRTFSKAWGLAGARVGHLISSEEIIMYMNKTRPMYEIGALSAKIIESAINYPAKMIESVHKIIKSKIYFESELAKMGFVVLKTHGNFSHVKFGNKSEIIHNILENKIYYKKEINSDCLQGFSRFSISTITQMNIVLELIKSNI